MNLNEKWGISDEITLEASENMEQLLRERNGIPGFLKIHVAILRNLARRCSGTGLGVQLTKSTSGYSVSPLPTQAVIYKMTARGRVVEVLVEYKAKPRLNAEVSFGTIFVTENFRSCNSKIHTMPYRSNNKAESYAAVSDLLLRLAGVDDIQEQKKSLQCK